MPELPEVETIRRDLQKSILGLTIEKVDIYDNRVIKDLTGRRFKSFLLGKKFLSVDRRGKAIIITFTDHTYLVVQVKMTGHLIIGEDLKSKGSSETKVTFKLSSGKYLNYNDHRLFGWLIYTDNLASIGYLNSIGPEPLEKGFSQNSFKEILRNRKAPIKPLLMNQGFLAGIGNIYASEILYRAGVHPQKSASKLSEQEIESVFYCTKEVLAEAIRARGTSMRNYRDSKGEKGNFLNRIKVYGREKEKCYQCDSIIEKVVQSGRSTFFCAKCQS